MGFHDWFDTLGTGEKLSHYLRMIGHQQHCVVVRNMGKLEIAASQHRILGILGHRSEISQREIADILNVSMSTVTVSLKKMEKNGLVSRVMDPDDNRVNKVRETELGKRMFEQGIEMMKAIDRDMLRDFSEAELTTFLGLAKRCHERLSEMDGADWRIILAERDK